MTYNSNVPTLPAANDGKEKASADWTDEALDDIIENFSFDRNRVDLFYDIVQLQGPAVICQQSDRHVFGFSCSFTPSHIGYGVMPCDVPHVGG